MQESFTEIWLQGSIIFLLGRFNYIQRLNYILVGNFQIGKVQLYFGWEGLIIFWLERFNYILVGKVQLYFDWEVSIIFWLGRFNYILVGKVQLYFGWKGLIIFWFQGSIIFWLVGKFCLPFAFPNFAKVSRSNQLLKSYFCS